MGIMCYLSATSDPKKSCKDRPEPDAILVTECEYEVFSIWSKSFINKLFHQLTSVLRWVINVSITTTLYQFAKIG